MSPFVSGSGFSIKRARNCSVEIVKLRSCDDLEQLNVEAGTRVKVGTSDPVGRVSNPLSHG